MSQNEQPMPDDTEDDGYWASMGESAANQDDMPETYASFASAVDVQMDDIQMDDFRQGGGIVAADILSGLNSEQADAVSLSQEAGPVMVLAGAGTGKTSVLTKRIAYLVANGISPQRILAVTFTNKAAGEMRERLEALHVSPMPLVGTFHSIGLRILKLCPQAAGVKSGFTVMGDSESKALWRSLFVAKDGDDISKKKLVFHKSNKKWQDFEQMMFKEKDAGARSADDVSPNVPASVGLMLDAYEAARIGLNMVDFADLISASLRAIQREPAGQAWASRFTHLLVDEFQDTSLLQFGWATAILQGDKTKQNLFCVGDDCQSIYAFRGARVENIDRFVKTYRAKEVLLEQNYRCGASILRVANNLIANNRGGDRKRLWTSNAAGVVGFVKFPGDREESAWIALHLQKKPVPSDDCAVLVRTRAAMLPVTKAFRLAGVEHHVVGAKDFFDTKEIRDAMAIVRFALNHSDFMSFGRMAGVFPGIGDKTIQNAINSAHEEGVSLVEVCAGSKKLAPIAAAYEGIGADSAASEAVKHLVSVSGLRQACELSPEAIRLSNINDFCEMAGQFTTLTELMEELTLFAEKEDQRGGITVSTIHSAKGLEWSRVYLPAVTEGHIPMTNNEDGGTEEERRLMYVAITRAKKELIVTYPVMRMVNGALVRSEPSRFLAEAGFTDERPTLKEDHASNLSL